MQPGDYITPTLRLVRPLGRGGMGSVWVADHLALSTQVAVKFMAAAFAQHPSLVQRFQREAMAAAQIKSPHVAQVFDHGVSSSGEPYIVMELLEGEDLGRRVKRGPLSLTELVPIVAQVAKALHRAHQLGIVHRDIKPDNVFLTHVDGELLVKVLDFGIAKHTTESLPGMTSTGSMLGTPLYMSPEQLLSSKDVDFRSDLWSLGVVVYHALTGHVPFSGETLGAISVAVHAGVYAPVTSHQGGLPPSIDAWMQRALAREPTARFESARDLSDALDRAARDPAAAWTAPLLPASAPVASMPTPMTPMTPAPASGPALTMSEAQTLVGTANTRAGGKSRRIPVLTAAFAALAATGGIALFLLQKPDAPSPTSGSAAVSSSAAPVSEPALTASSEAPAVTSSATSDPSASASVAPASVSAPAAPTARPAAKGNSHKGPAPRATAKGKAPAPAGSKDTIGF